MPITIGSNIAALKAERQLTQSSSALSRVYERLSSGQRINRASDDAASLAISESLRSGRKVFTQAIRNLNDGTSLLNIADSALDQLTNIVIRIKELAEQSANGTFSNTQRKALDTEAQSLAQEYFRLAQSSKFNGRNLFDASFEELRVQAGFGDTGGIAYGLGGALGTGSFATGTSWAEESSASRAIQLADLNGDGALDMVTAGTGAGGRATVRLGDGSGSFGAATSFTAESTHSYDLKLGDLNDDGILDLVTAGVAAGVGYATVRLGDGQGSFGAATSFSTESSASYGLDLGDINGDGILDLVTAGGAVAGGYATVRLGTGNGSFGASTSFTTESGISGSVAISDINGDGILDLLTAGISSGFSGYATIRLGTGGGSFGVATSYTTESFSSNALSISDLNGDGILDLITAGQSSGFAGYATVRLGTGGGSFGAAISYTGESSNSNDLNVADLNGDGILDLVTAGAGGGTGRATVRLGDGRGSFGVATSFVTESSGSLDLNVADLNGDGVLDLVSAGSNGYATVRLAHTVNGVSPLLSFSLRTKADALQAMGPLARKLEQIGKQRSTVGAFQIRISTAYGAISSTVENYAAAESRIRDTDMAADSANLTRLKILQNAASAVLAQANQAPALALRLLTN